PPRYLALVGDAYQDFGNKWGFDRALGRGYIKRPGTLRERPVEMGEYIPGARFRIVYATNPRGYFDDDGGIPVSINRLGMRGPELEANREGGPGSARGRRILGIGDSFTFGPGVRDEDTFLRRLESSLARGGGKVEVLNAGIEGFSTADEVAYLEYR